MTRDERGQVTVLILGLGLVAFAVAGLAVDGTRAFLMRRTLQNAADAAAMAGAGEVDREVYYATGGRRLTLAESAGEVALRWLDERGLDAEPNVEASPTRVTVTLRSDVSTSFLGLVGIAEVPVSASASAEPLAGAPSL